MKKILLVVISCMNLIIHSELLVVVKDKGTGHFRVMTHEETLKYQDKIGDVLLRYQWPMCIQSDLTAAEQAEYLAPNKPYAQEQFIQKKLREAVSPAEIDLQVMFVPDSFYQLFCIAQNAQNAFEKEYKIATKNNNMHVKQFNVQRRESVDILAQSAEKAKDSLKKSFLEINQLFFQSQEGLSALSIINNQLVQYIFNAYPEVCSEKSIIDLSNSLQSKLEILKAKLCETMASNGAYRTTNVRNGIPQDMSTWMGLESQTHIISTVMELEYEARSLNKALLLRGTDTLEESVSFKHLAQEEKVILLGSTVHGARSFKHSLLGTQEKPYSISYANSLFAGFYHDPGGCTYTYLNGRRSKQVDRDIVGYGLLIDQQAYMQAGNKGLFYIPSLAPLTSLFERGQYCHPRSRVAVRNKKEVKEVVGLLRTNEDGLIDPADIIVFEDNPIKYEERFSAFVAKNGRLIELKKDASLIAPDEKNDSQKSLKSQRRIAQVHQQIRVLGERTLRLLYRAGSKPIPGISELELFDILENGLTVDQFKTLQNSLTEMQKENLLEPVTKESFNISSKELYDKIIENHFNSWTEEKIAELRKNSQDFSKAWSTVVDMYNKNILTKIHKDALLQWINLSVNLNIVITAKDVTFISNLIEKGFITAQEALPFLTKCLHESNTENHALAVILKLIKTNMLTSQDILIFLEKSMTSIDTKIQENALITIQKIATKSILTSQEIVSLLEKGTISTSDAVQRSVLDIIETLTEENILTNQDKKQLSSWVETQIVSNNEYTVGIALSIITKFSLDKILTHEEVISWLEKAVAHDINYKGGGYFRKDGGYFDSNIICRVIVKLKNKKILTDKDIEKIKPFLMKRMKKESYEALFLINYLASVNMLTAQDKKEIISWLDEGMSSAYEGVQASTLKRIGILGVGKVLTIQEIIPFLKIGMAGNASFIQQDTLELIKDLVKANILTSQKIVSLLEQGMVGAVISIQYKYLRLIERLGKEKILTSQEIVSLLEQGIINTDKNIQYESLKIIEELVKAKILTTSQDILPLLEKGMVSTDSFTQYRSLEIIGDLGVAKILTSQDILPFLEKSMASDSNYIKNKALQVIEQLVTAQVLTGQDKEKLLSWVDNGMANNDVGINRTTLLLIEKLGKAKILTKQEIVAFLEKSMTVRHTEDETLLLIEKLGVAQILTSQEIIPLLEKSMTVPRTEYETLFIIANLGKVKILTSQEIIPFLEKGMVSSNNFISIETLSRIEKLGVAQILTNQEIVHFLESGMASTDRNIQGATLAVIEKLVKAQVLTNQDQEQLLALKEKSAGSAESSSESMVSRVKGTMKGLLRKTGIAAMRHEPYRASGIGYVVPKGYLDSLEGAQLDEHAELDREFEEHMQDYRDQQARELEQKRFEHEQGFGTSSYRTPQIDTELVQRNLVAGQQTTSAAVDAYHQSTNIPQVSHILPVASMAAQQRAMYLAQARTAKARDMLESIHPERLAKSTLRAGMRK